MRTVVITGGTDGIGRALASGLLGGGDQVVVVGTTTAKGEAFLAEARDRGAGERAAFVPADLSLISENRRLIEFLSGFAQLDALILAARYHRSTRVETADGLEATFALFYLSRYLLGHGLRPLLENAPAPVIANLAGPGGTRPVQWSDLQSRQDYRGVAALGHGGRLNDLLAVSFGDQYPSGRIRYGLFHPGVVATSMAGEYDEAAAAQVAALSRTAQPAAAAAAPILDFIARPPEAVLSAYVEGQPYSLPPDLFAVEDARRLDGLTVALLAERD